MNAADAIVTPREPESIEQSGLTFTTIEHLILKILYFRGDLYGQDLSAALALKFSVIQEIVDTLKLRHHLQVKKSMGMGDVGALFSLTETGRARARECLEQNQYAGPAPVPLEQYSELVRQQRPSQGWLTKPALRKALRGMVITERTLSQIGPAISSANSLLLYGKPGDGKTFLVESLNNLEATPVFVPYAIECQGNIIQVFDPIYHQPLEEEAVSVLMVSLDRTHDRRWVKCRRPFIVSGGELSIDMLDLRYNATSRVYEAPFQLKANNGMYLIDDFGRQRATPAEVLNRWIVPMERRIDFLSFLTGGKMTAPFETFLVFSTNLNPADLGDEAFLRRIQYKMLLRGPAEDEFERIFENYCTSRKIPCPNGLVNRVLEKFYRRTGKPIRRCHPRDVLNHALNLMHFEKLPQELTDDLMERAFQSCFLEEDQNAAAPPSRLVAAGPAVCSDYWGDRLAQIPTVFGSLALLASLRDSRGGYQDLESERDFGKVETERTLSKLHDQCLIDWLKMSMEQQTRDLTCYLAAGGDAQALSRNRQDWIARLAAPGSRQLERDLFAQDLALLLDTVLPKPESKPEPQPEERPEPVRLGLIA
jgi:DNA-binding MarR family transcriptional regulator